MRRALSKGMKHGHTDDGQDLNGAERVISTQSRVDRQKIRCSRKPEFSLAVRTLKSEKEIDLFNEKRTHMHGHRTY